MSDVMKAIADAGGVGFSLTMSTIEFRKNREPDPTYREWTYVSNGTVIRHRQWEIYSYRGRRIW